MGSKDPTPLRSFEQQVNTASVFKSENRELRMKKMSLLLVSILIISSSAFAANYKIDRDHSTVGFKIGHLGISSVSGKFVEFDGEFTYDPEKVDQSKAQASIGVKSIDTRQTKRDDHLRSPDFFDVVKFPEMKFTSTKITDATREGFKLHGDITIRGVTKPIVLDVTSHGTVKDPWGNDRAGFSAVAKLSRKDFGLTWNKVLEAGGLVVGEEVSIEIEIEGIKQS